MMAPEEDQPYRPPSSDSDGYDDVDERRPNRWKGPPSTWQQLNSAEIETITALDEIRNRDLSVHLYNAFALKRRHGTTSLQAAEGPTPSRDINAETGQLVKDDKWAPSKLWVAWPMSAHTVPRPEFMGRADEADEPFTLRMGRQDGPSADLEEAISAATLRYAKETFEARPDAQPTVDSVEPRPASEDENEDEEDMDMESAPRGRSKSVKDENTSDAEMMDVDDANHATSSRVLLPESWLKPVVSTDDELSYTILRPTTRQILGKVDRMLRILHNTQESIARYHSDSGGDSDTSTGSSRSRSRSRSRFRSRAPSKAPPRAPSKAPSRAQSRAQSRTPGAKTEIKDRFAPPEPARRTTSPTQGKKGEGTRARGRKRKVYPLLEGETEREYAIRIAKLQKKRAPIFAEDIAPQASDSTPAPDSAGEYSDGRSTAKSRQRARSRQMPRDSSVSSTDASATESGKRKPRQQRRTALLDWRDVLGAAAIAQLPGPVLDRAARRCADLFRQNFVLHKLDEGPPTQPNLSRPVEYNPGMILPQLLPSSDSEEAPELPTTQRRRATTIEAEDELEPRGRSASRNARRRIKSVSRSRSVGKSWFCIYADCPRAVDTFDRRANLMRHLKLVHHYEGDELPVEVDSEDEMLGAVHRDWFMQPLKMRSGWRGVDSLQRAYRGRSKSRGAKGDDSD
ncbi:RNA polymerase I-specific transcription initiation factor-domain-containing protein [Xylariaceae sp. FL1019]|nr:RNA polymerase I-specific transcription initiation factor-domain-containing protein [Xylariaceae sp. FL1019]